MRHFSPLSVKILFMFSLMFIMGGPKGLNAENQEGTDEQNISVNSKDHPKIQFDALSHDFGSAFQNTKLEHFFNFKNTGTENLHIIKVKAG